MVVATTDVDPDIVEWHCCENINAGVQVEHQHVQFPVFDWTTHTHLRQSGASTGHQSRA